MCRMDMPRSHDGRFAREPLSREEQRRRKQAELGNHADAGIGEKTMKLHAVFVAYLRELEDTRRDWKP